MGSDCRHDRHDKCRPDVDPDIIDRCCDATTGCEWDGTLRNVVTEPVYVQKVYDATLVNLQALSTVNNVRFSPNLPEGSRILRILDIRCRKFFNPSNIKDPRNFVIDPDTILSGGEFVRKENGEYVEVVGPDGFISQKLIYTDTTECDEANRGTPVFGTQRVRLSGNVFIEIDLLILDSRDRRVTYTVSSNVPIAPCQAPIILTNFFELCIPSIHNSAFFPRFAEFCNVNCETRLGTNSVTRDIDICPETGEIRLDLIIAICITCEKKVIVPVQLCVLSTGFPELSPEVSPICSSFPSLFPRQIDENSDLSPDRDRRKYRLNETIEEE
jgi:hypothetical protein